MNFHFYNRCKNCVLISEVMSKNFLKYIIDKIYKKKDTHALRYNFSVKNYGFTQYILIINFD